MVSVIDAFGRIMVSRDDDERLCKVWNADHGTPTNSGHIIAREQWVADQVCEEIKGVPDND